MIYILTNLLWYPTKLFGAIPIIRAENYNTSAVEFLRRLPGVTDSNYRAIMDGCKSLAELSLLPIEKLATLMGSQQAARTLRDFLDAKYPTLLWFMDWGLFILLSNFKFYEGKRLYLTLIDECSSSSRVAFFI